LHSTLVARCVVCKHERCTLLCCNVVRVIVLLLAIMIGLCVCPQMCGETNSF